MTLYINGSLVKTSNFSGGECHLNISTIEILEKTEFFAYLNHSDDILSLLLGIDAIRRVNPSTKIHLTIPYFPYARQDRVCNPGEPLSVKVMANLINNLNCHKVTIYDPHSDVTQALLDNCETISMAEVLLKTPLAKYIVDKKLALISPDAGAEKKVINVGKSLSKLAKKIDVFCATKVRDPSSGDILSTTIHGDLNGENFVILDDICDGGRTFIELSKALKQRGAKEIYLYVTHGIFSKGIDVLKENFDHIYCYHSMSKEKEIDSEFLTVFKNIPF